MNPLRICRVIARLNVGGAARHVIQLTAGLDPQRFIQHTVTGVEGPNEASLLPEARAAGLDPLVIPQLGRELSLRADGSTLFQLYRLFRRWRPDIVETHTAKAGTLGRLAAILAGVPVRIHVFHGHIFHGYFGPAKTRAFLEIERALARGTTRIIALGETQRRELLGYRIGTPQKVISVPLGLRLALFLDAPAQRGRLRAELAVSAGTPLVGIVGRLEPVKAHEVFLDAAARVSAAVPLARFVLAGDGQRRAELEAMAAHLGLAGRVHFLGVRHDLPAIYADLDVLALTSKNEGMPVSVIEAMAAGCPVVSTDVGGVRDLVDDVRTGLLALPGDAGAVAAHIQALLENPDQRHRLAEAGRQAISPRYDVSTLVDTMTRLYESLAGGPQPGTG